MERITYRSTSEAEDLQFVTDSAEKASILRRGLAPLAE